MNRSYEISIWTLQDSFITVLKPANLAPKGVIQEGEMTLKDDGENTISFKIPMYIQNDMGEVIENPIWYSTLNGNIIAGMRKIKLIFNKATEDEEIFEFIITKVTEEHDKFTKICSVEGASLAFHELGRQGYKIKLSKNDYVVEFEEFIENGISFKCNIDYWIQKVLENTSWEYIICMDWSAFDGTNNYYSNNQLITNKEYLNMTQEERDAFNDSLAGPRKDKVYREAYVSNWDVQTNNNDEPVALIAAETVEDFELLEREDVVDASESNRYNLLQKIAETFEVFCKFRYLYDDNYHIIGRQVIFYNNFINEDNGIIDLTYNYNVKKLTREMDSTDIISKMFVKNLENSDTSAGVIKLSDSLANTSLEEYLLDFDYLYKIGTITQEQYAQIPIFKSQMRQINLEYLVQYELKNSLEKELNDMLANRDFLQSELDEASERIDEAKGATGSLGTFSYTKDNPLRLVVLDNPNDGEWTKYCRLSIGGAIKKNTCKYYRSEAELKSGNEITPHLVARYIADSTNNYTNRVEFKNTQGLDTIWATFTYDSLLALNMTIKPYQQKIAQIESELADLNKKLLEIDDFDNLPDGAEDSYYYQIQICEDIITDLLEKKTQLIAAFEKLMGPALREGFWQPEDKYTKQYTSKIYDLDTTLSSIIRIDTQVSPKVGFYWDTEIFDGEQKSEYKAGAVLEQNAYYPCLDISSLLDTYDLTELTFVYRDKSFGTGGLPTGYTSEKDPRLCNYIKLGTDDCQFGFIAARNNPNQIIPVIIFTAVKKLIDYTTNGTTITPIEQLQLKARLSKIYYNSSATGNFDGFYEDVIISNSVITNSELWHTTEDYQIVYPRFYVDKARYIVNDTENKIIYTKNNQRTQLTNYEDYYTTQRRNYFYLTLKASSILDKFNTGSFFFYYNESTAADAMYLDALEVMKENSTPKVSYTLDAAVINKFFTKNIFDCIGQIAHINDSELKFENVYGYISEITLNLDKPWEDKYSIKNYKTKFEDLFSTIVASTEAMKQNSQKIGMVSSLLTSTGLIDEDILTQSLDNAKLASIVMKYAADPLQVTIAQNKIALANATALRIMNGEVGLAFSASDTINKVVLNNEEGLVLEGIPLNSPNTIRGFRATNAEMGFYVTDTQTGETNYNLYFDTDGNLALKGNIYAKGGWFGGEDGWVITENQKTFAPQEEYTGGLIYSKNEKVILYAGNSSGIDPMIRITGNANNSLEFKNGNLTISGNITATTGSFTGAITASSGTIGGWTISPQRSSSNTGVFQALVYNPNPNNNPYFETATAGIFPDAGTDNVAMWIGGKRQSGYLTSEDPDDHVAPFRVFKSGKLEATDAVITGAITATSGTIGGFNITATQDTSYSTGHYHTKSLYTHSVDSTLHYAYEAGIRAGTSTTNHVFYIYRIDENKNWVSANRTDMFYVRNDGYLYAQNANITGTIKAKSGTIGEGATNKITIGTDGTKASIYSNMNTLDNTSNNGFYLGTDGLALGQGKFKVTSAGALIATSADISGTITATSGTIGGWTINPKLNANSNTRWNALVYNQDSNTPYFDTADLGIFPEAGQDLTSEAIALWIGGKRSTAPFRVAKNGTLYAAGAKITGATTIDTTDDITMTGHTFTLKSSESNSYFIFKAADSNDSTYEQFKMRTYCKTNNIVESATFLMTPALIRLKKNTSEIILTSEGDGECAINAYNVSLGISNKTDIGGTNLPVIDLNYSIMTIYPTYCICESTAIIVNGGNDDRLIRVFFQKDTPTSSQLNNAEDKGASAAIWIDLPADSTSVYNSWTTCTVKYKLLFNPSSSGGGVG